MTHEPSTGRRWRRLWHPGWWLLTLALAGCAWLGWRTYDERAAIREAQAAGWYWDRRDPVSLILTDWRAAGQKATWTVRYRLVVLPDGTDLASARPLLDRLRPTRLSARYCPDSNLDALRGFHALQSLSLVICAGLQNVDALRGLPSGFCRKHGGQKPEAFATISHRRRRLARTSLPRSAGVSACRIAVLPACHTHGCGGAHRNLARLGQAGRAAIRQAGGLRYAGRTMAVMAGCWK